MRRTKLAPHHMMGGGETELWLPYSTGLKCVGDFGPAAAARALGLNVVGRVIDDGLLFGQGFDMNRHCLEELRDPEGWARYYFWEVLEEKVRLNPAVNLWSGPNEQNHRTDVDDATRQRVMRWYSTFSYHLAKELFYRGKRAVIGGWAVGNPLKEHHLWPDWQLALQACRDWNAVQERHSYGRPDEDYLLRHRYDNRVWTSMGFPSLPVIISECGGDGVPDSGTPKGFYKTPERFWNECLLPLAQALDEDDYVLMANVFTVGDGGGDQSPWKNFNIDGWGILPLVRSFALSRNPAEEPDPEEMINVTPEDLARFTHNTQVIQTLSAENATLLQKYEAPWWSSIPEGVTLSPDRQLAPLTQPIEILKIDGTSFNPPIFRQNNMTFSMRVGKLLRVYIPPVGPSWWVRVEDVQLKLP